MGGGIPYGDLIVLGAVALFVILRYRSVLGQKTGHDFSAPRATTKEGEPEKVVTLQGVPVKPVSERDVELDALPPLVVQGIARIKAQDAEFSVASFLTGARAAFEMVLDAANRNDEPTLKLLLAPDVYESFEQDAGALKAKSQQRNTTLVAFKSADITDAQLKRSTACITVQFVSEQIQMVKDVATGAVIEGNASEVQDVADEWIFERDVKSRNPNWTIVAT